MPRLTLQDAAHQLFLLHQSKRYPQALELYRQTLKAHPYWADGYAQLANVLIELNQFEPAAHALQKAITGRATNLVFCHNNLGVIYDRLGRHSDAADAYRKAISLDTRYTIAHRNLGDALRELKQYDAAEQSYRRALQLQLDMIDAHIGIGLTYYFRARYTEAIVHFENALKINPADTNACMNLVLCHSRMGDYVATEAVLRRAIELVPSDPAIHSALLMCLNYAHGAELPVLYDESLKYNQQHVLPLAPLAKPHDNTKQPDRHIRLAFISADFKDHSVAFFLRPLIARIDRQQFFIACYSQVEKPDKITEFFQQHANLWRNIVGLSHEQVAEQIRSDAIDILVDLSGHTVDNRLPALARRPAPIQITWLGYPNTTGVAAIDYRITDPIADPPEMDAFYTEKLIRLPDAMLAYQPPDCAPGVTPPPMVKSGYITFGSFNDLMKVSEETLALWAQLLMLVPTSRLLLKSLGLGSEGGRARILASLAGHGVSSTRIEMLNWSPDLAAHLNLYSRVDIALDAFPYNGTTTTCEALWMGVPVVSLAGPTAVSRMGLTILTQAGLARDWAAFTKAEYLRIASDWSGRPAELEKLRLSLRDRLKCSPLTDAERFSRGFETELRTIWARYCFVDERRR